MAHSFHRHGGTLEIDVVTLFAAAAVGASGAPTLNATGNRGITSLVRNSAGNYTLTLDDTYNTVLFADVKVVHSSTDNPTSAGVLCEQVAWNAQASGGGTVQFCFVSTSTGSATDPANGATIYVKVDCRKSSIT